jgi:predicted transcriptional regulator
MDYGTDMMLRKVDAMRKNGYDEETIAKFFGLSKIELRKHISMRNRDNRIVLCSLAKELKEEGKSVREIAIELGKNESSVRLLLDDEINEKIKSGTIPPDKVGKRLSTMREQIRTQNENEEIET